MAALFSAAALGDGDRHPLNWIDAGNLPLEGRGWSDTRSHYDRLPKYAEASVRKPVWDLSRESAGLALHFASDTPELRVRWTLTSSSLSSGNMSASSVSGLDLYVRLHGGWHWLAAARAGDSREGNAGVLFEGLPAERREFLLYLPLYNGVESLQLGVSESRTIEVVARTGKPLVFYGTSIVQGGCVSRPGMAYPAVLGRRLDREAVNLGFSGNARAEPEMAALLAELDPSVYVLDCLPNISSDQVERLGPFVGVLRKRHPATPIVLVENLEYPDGAAIPARREGYEASNRNLLGIFGRLRRADRHLFYVPAAGLIGTDGEATVDGVHPSDLGVMRLADKMEPFMRRALGLP